MIFERLTLHNFQRYGGTNTIEFPDPDESSLVVVLAPNNTGKTTILRAIDFLFYGSLVGENSETAWKLITDSVRDTLAPHASRVYGVRLHTSVIPNDPEAFRFDWKGKTPDLRQHLPAGQASFSTFSRTLIHGHHPSSYQRKRMASVMLRPLRLQQAGQFRKSRSIAGHRGR
jgi:hypothetical protein